MIDVMKHKLHSVRVIDPERLPAAREFHRRDMGREIGRLIVQRYPPLETTFSRDDVELRHEVFVFSPQELAELLSAVRDKAVEETLAVADQLLNNTQQQETDDDHRDE